MAQTISVFGDSFTGLAIPIIAAITLQASPGQMGILTALTRAPFLILGLLVGVWVDRLRRAVVFGSRSLRAIAGTTGTFNLFASALFTLYILFATRELGLTPAAIGLIFSIGNVAGLLGVLWVFFSPVRTLRMIPEPAD